MDLGPGAPRAPGRRTSRPVHRSSAIRSHGRCRPWCSNHWPIRRTSRSRNASACRFFLGSTACGKSISDHVAVPDEHVVRGEVAVHDVAVQHVLERSRGFAPRSPRAPPGRPRRTRAAGARARAIADVRHQDRVVGAFDRPRHRSADAGELLRGSPTRARPRGPLGPPGRTSSSDRARRARVAP